MKFVSVKATPLFSILTTILNKAADFLRCEEDKYDQLRSAFESRVSSNRLVRGEAGNYLDPIIAARWEKLCKDWIH